MCVLYTLEQLIGGEGSGGGTLYFCFVSSTNIRAEYSLETVLADE